LEDLKKIYYFQDLGGRYKDNIKIDLKETEWGLGLDLFHSG
jgi:hypothetical protein